MKKLLILCLCLALLASGPVACRPQEGPQEQPPTDKPLGPAVTLPISEPTALRFLSGAGAWSTDLVLYPDGTFTGNFHDSNMGETGAGYPHGTVYTCDFEGRFLPTRQINETTYELRLTELTTKKPAGEEWLEDDIRYVAATPYGLEADRDDEFYFYTPDAPVTGMDDDFLGWWPGRYKKPQPATLLCYGLYNEDEGTGFFSDLGQ